ncbi:Hypothetical predicted protein [Marmota monax]|uniref:Uncharacterized protein n=1 Tax=Marmota monax TaxID=9995 RepID=A0A5E4CCI9_MARMO|nr:hypothetical protein GHT09_014932 [Marmota monax]VTJ79647.1 Hypothetical predicted protein [Marmota monax]
MRSGQLCFLFPVDGSCAAVPKFHILVYKFLFHFISSVIVYKYSPGGKSGKKTLRSKADT